MNKKELVRRAAFAQRLPGDDWDIKSDSLAVYTCVLGSQYTLSLRVDDETLTVGVSHDEDDRYAAHVAKKGPYLGELLWRSALELRDHLQMDAASGKLPADVALSAVVLLMGRLDDCMTYAQERRDEAT